MDFQQTFGAPVTESVAGADVQFPVLEIDDYLPWCSEEAKARRAVARQKIPNNVDADQRWRLERAIENIDAGLAEIAEKVWTVPGAKRILDMSLQKSGMKDKAERDALIKKVRPVRLHSLAIDVSALYERRATPVAAVPEPGQPDPNSDSPARNDAAGVTGSQMPALSTDSADATRAA